MIRPSKATHEVRPSAGIDARLCGSLERRARVSVSGGEFIIRSPELNLIAGGPTYQDALDELVELAEQQPR